MQGQSYGGMMYTNAILPHLGHRQV